MDLAERVKYLEQELSNEQGRHRETLRKFYSNPAIMAVIEKQEREESDRRSAQYAEKLLLEAAEDRDLDCGIFDMP